MSEGLSLRLSHTVGSTWCGPTAQHPCWVLPMPTNMYCLYPLQNCWQTRRWNRMRVIDTPVPRCCNCLTNKNYHMPIDNVNRSFAPWSGWSKWLFRIFFIYFFIQVVPLDWKFYRDLVQVNESGAAFSTIFS